MRASWPRRAQRAPVQHDVGAQRLFVLAHQQRVAARRGLPGDRATRIAAAVGAQVVHVVARRMQARRARRSPPRSAGAAPCGFGRGIDQQRRVRPHVRPGARQAERARGRDAQPRRARASRGAGRQRERRLAARRRPATSDAPPRRRQRTRRPRAFAPGSARAVHAQRQRRAGGHRFGADRADGQPGQLQVRGEQAGVGRRRRAAAPAAAPGCCCS